MGRWREREKSKCLVSGSRTLSDGSGIREKGTQAERAEVGGDQLGCGHAVGTCGHLGGMAGTHGAQLGV